MSPWSIITEGSRKIRSTDTENKTLKERNGIVAANSVFFLNLNTWPPDVETSPRNAPHIWLNDVVKMTILTIDLNLGGQASSEGPDRMRMFNASPLQRKLSRKPKLNQCEIV